MSAKLELQAAAAQIAGLAALHEQEARGFRELAARQLKVATEVAIAAAIETDITAEVCAGKARGLREVLKRAGFEHLADCLRLPAATPGQRILRATAGAAGPRPEDQEHDGDDHDLRVVRVDPRGRREIAALHHVKSLALVWLAGSGGKGTVSRLKAGREPLLDRGEYASVEAALEQLDQEGSIDLSRGAIGFTPQGRARALRLLGFTSLLRGWTWPRFRDTVLLPLALRRWLGGEESELPEPGAPRAVQERPRSAPVKSAPATLEERIRAAYLRVTGGALNEYVRLAQLRAQLGDELVEAVDDELRRMQQRGGAVLYPIDDPQRIRPADDAAALRVAGERRDLLLIRR